MSATPQGSVQFSGGSRRGSRSRRNSGAGRKRAGKSGGAGKQGGASQTPKIWDGLNNDITPKPLSKSVHPLSTGATPLDEHLTKEFTMPTGSSAPRATTPMSDMGSDAGWGDSVPVSKRSRSQSGRSTPSTSSEVGDLVPASPGALETVSTIAEEEPTPGRLVGTINEEEKKKAAATPRMAPRLTAAELDKPVTISLVETPTFWLLDIVGSCVAKDSDEAPGVEEVSTPHLPAHHTADGPAPAGKLEIRGAARD
jgi:hypothetical protein